MNEGSLGNGEAAQWLGSLAALAEIWFPAPTWCYTVHNLPAETLVPRT